MKETLEQEHVIQLRQAKFLLESPSIAARFSNALATPIEKGMRLLPDGAKDVILSAATKSLNVALKTALFSLREEMREASNLTHKATVALSGGIGGAFGLAALSVELPISTVIILRSIADIARSEGENLQSRESQIACLEVFALGGPSKSDDATESGYFGIRTALAASVSEAIKYSASKGSIKEGAPALVRLITKIATRFSIPVTEKAAAQAVPVIGAAGGALINTLFIDHFQDTARGHFVVRRLERVYGKRLVRENYEAMDTTANSGQSVD